MENPIDDLNAFFAGLAHLPCGVVVYQRVFPYRVLFFNRIAQNILGYSLEQLRDEKDGAYANCIFPADLPQLEKPIEDAAAGDDIAQNYRAVTRNGTVMWLNVYAHWECTGAGEQIVIANLRAPLTATSINEYSDFIELLPIGAGYCRVSNGARTGLILNAAASKAFAMPREVIAASFNNNDYTHTAPEDIDGSKRQMEKIMRGENSTTTFKLTTPDGDVRYLRVDASCTRMADGDIDVFLSYVNVTREQEVIKKNRRTMHQLETIIAGAAFLNHGQDITAAIQRCLECARGYYEAKRSYIFTFNWEEQTCQKTFEACNEGVTPRDDAVLNIQGTYLASWVETFRNGQNIRLQNDGQPDGGPNAAGYPAGWEILKAQGNSEVIVVPYFITGELSGFIGVDNPAANNEDASVLRVLGNFIADGLEKRNYLEELRLTQKNLQNIIDNVQGWVAVYSVPQDFSDMQVIFRSHGYSRIMGYPECQQSDSLLPRIHPDDIARIRQELPKMVEVGNTELAIRMRNAENDWRWIQLRLCYSHKEGSNHICFCLCLDITEDVLRRKAETKRYQAQTEALLKSQSQAIGHYILNFTANTCETVRGGNTDIFGTLPTADDFFTAFARAISDPREQAEFSRIFSRKHLTEIFHEGENSHNIECKITFGADSETSWVRLNLSMMRNPVTGSLEAATVITDIQSDKYLHEIINRLTATDYQEIALLDTKNDRITIFTQQEKINGDKPVSYPYSEFLAQNLPGIVTDEEYPEAAKQLSMDAIRQGLANAPQHTCSFAARGTDGNRRVRWNFTWLNNDHDMAVGTHSDITEAFRKEQKIMAKLASALQDAENANRAKSSFLSRMSHDMRTPMNGIIGLTRQVLRHPDLPEEIKGNLEKVSISSDFLLTLINDTLDMSKIESGRMELHPHPANLQKIIDNISTAVSPGMIAKSLNFNLQVPQWDFMVNTDAVRFQQIFINLLSNSTKFTRDGGKIDFIIENRGKTAAEISLRFTVRDTGIGMSEEFQKKIFEPFSQEDDAYARQSVGTGLGMPIVKQLVDMMSGTLEIHSALGKGTEIVICLTLPIAEKILDTALSDTVSEEKLEGLRVLLAEDNEINVAVAEAVLQEKKIVCDTVEDGQVAVEKFQQSQPGYYHAILMDIRMPVLDGLAATRKIRALAREDAQTVPIIAMTANAFAEDENSSKEAGMTAHITKPLDPGTVYRVLGEVTAAQRNIPLSK